MAFRAQCFLGPIYAHFLPKRSWSCIRHVMHVVRVDSTEQCNCKLSVHKRHGIFSPSNSYRNRGLASCSVPCICPPNSSEYLGRKPAKVTLWLARPLSQFSRPDADTERMQRALRQSSEPQGADAEGSRLIYQIRGVGMMRLCSVFIYCTSLAAVYMSPDLLSTTLDHDSVNSEMILSLATIVVAVGVMPALLTIFNHRLVLQLFYNQGRGTYVAKTLSPLLTLRKAEFGHDDVVPSKDTGTILGLFKMNTLRANGRALYVNPYNFTVPSDFNHLMGYR